MIFSLCVLVGTMGSVPASAQARNITIKGSDTMVILGQRWAEAYMKKNPGASIQVTGGGSGVGIAALINGTTDIAESSRPMKDAEKTQLQQKRGLSRLSSCRWRWTDWRSMFMKGIRSGIDAGTA